MSTLGEDEVRKYLETLGFNVTKIDETSEKTPDFLVKDDLSQYVIEVKDQDKQRFINFLESQDTSRKINLEYDDPISGIIRDGVKQLDSYKNQGRIFKVLWFFIETEELGNSVSMKIGKTLYGLRELEGHKISGEFFRTLCFYFTFSEFYKSKQLDAVIVQSPKEIVLCMNDFSSQQDELRQTKLYKSFVENGLHIIEPSKSGYCIADDFTTLDRKNSEIVAEFIANV